MLSSTSSAATLDSTNKRLKPRLKVVATKYSQSTPTSAFSPTQQTSAIEPFSPAASTTSFISSVSWVAEKSASELGSLLKNAYKSLREKEKNLLLAAEIGKSLLEHNQNLKQDYEKLLQNVKQCESVSQEATTIEQEAYNDMRLISSKKAYDTIIESLERKNAEIQSMLDQTQHHSQLSQQQYEKKQRKLEAEIEILQRDLELAATKIHELEETNFQKQARWKRLDEIRGFEQQQKTEDLELLQELTTKMQELCIENKQLQQSKKQVEEKLIVSLNDLEKLRKNFEQFELTQQGYAQLQEAFLRQTSHIKELNDSLEDHRQILSRLSEKGLYHAAMHHQRKEAFSDYDAEDTSTIAKQSLLGELENAFLQKKASSFTNSSLRKTKSHSDSSNSSSIGSRIYNLASMTERNLTSFYNAPGDYAFDTLLSSCGIEDRHLFQQAESFFLQHPYDEQEQDQQDTQSLFSPVVDEEEQNLYARFHLYPSTTTTTLPTLSHQLLSKSEEQQQPKGLANRILFQIRYLFRSLFRWCRFAIILVTAVLINLWKGPDLLLIGQEKAQLL